MIQGSKELGERAGPGLRELADFGGKERRYSRNLGHTLSPKPVHELHFAMLAT